MVTRSEDAPAPVSTEAAPLQRLAMSLREIAWAIHRKAPERAHVGPIPTTEIALLKQVVDGPGATVGELARALGLKQSNASAALRSLGERGLVERVTSAEDRRVVRVWATPDGVAEHEAIAEAWTTDVVRAIGALPADERAALEAAATAIAHVRELLRQPAHE